MKKVRRESTHLLRDGIIVGASIVIAYFVGEVGIIENFLSSTDVHGALWSFISGIFFTSVFTIAPAAVALGELAQRLPISTVAFWGALGALLGDTLLLLFVRNTLSRDITVLLHMRRLRKFFSFFHFGFIRWLVPILGMIVIASPLPDELGLTMLGLTRVRLSILLPLIFCMNFMGILFIGWFAVSIA